MKEKKKKLNLDELEVQSFVTAFDLKSGETRQILGGGYSDACEPSYSCGGGGCPSEAPTVCNYHTVCGCTAQTECDQPECGVQTNCGQAGCGGSGGPGSGPYDC